MNTCGCDVLIRRVIFVIFLIYVNSIFGETTKIILNQGPLLGLKVFPETSKTAVFAYLGVPYAQPPIADLRFALPRPHNGWNQTLFANNLKSICPQLSNTFYEETPNKNVVGDSETTENCLYLNIWTPETGLRYGNLPVLAIITGEEMFFDWKQNRPTGLDLASEGLVVVHIQYRTNIFGWLGQNTPEFPGNFGLADQELALKWIQDNINKFGGNSKQVTLLVHGSTGVTCGIIHLLNQNENILFSKLILMSGSTLANTYSPDQNLSRNLVAKLGCEAEKQTHILKCLRSKSVQDLENSFEAVYRNTNISRELGPYLKSNFRRNTRFNSQNLEFALRSSDFKKIPIMIGLCSNEGAFMRDYWVDLARDGFKTFMSYINMSIIPQILEKYHFSFGDTSQILKAINWNYFEPLKSNNTIYLLNSMQRLISEANFEAPFFETIELIAKSLQSNNVSLKLPDLFVYSFQISQSMDMRGKINLFDGASHSSDLPLLMGPSLFQQIARRRLTPTEDKLCRRMRQLFGDFIKSGNPTPSRIYDAWLPYTSTTKYIKILGQFVPNVNEYPVSKIESNIHEIEELLFNAVQNTMQDRTNYELPNPYEIRSTSGEVRRRNTYVANGQDYEYYNHLKKVHAFWHSLLPNLYYNSDTDSINGINRTIGREGKETDTLEELGECNKYKYAFFWMLGLVCFLLGTLGICVYVLRRDHPGWSSNL